MNATAEQTDLPVTAQLPIAALAGLTLLSAGYFSLLLGIYLGLWLFQRTRQSASLICFLLLTLAFSVPYMPYAHAHLQLAKDAGILSVPLYLAAAFILRAQTKSYFDKQGGDLEISPLWTAVFAAPYVNYCIGVACGTGE